MYANISTALDNYFQGKIGTTTALDVAWEGVVYVPRTDRPYYKTKLSGYSRRPLGTGPSTYWQESVVYTVSVMWPSGQGKGAAVGQAAEVVAMFPRSTSMTLSGQAPLIVQSASAAPIDDDGNWITASVVIQLLTDETGS